MRPAIVWLALAVAFSPLLADLAEHWLTAPWARYAMLFVPLTALALWRETERPAPARDGLVWIALALAIELAATAGGFLRLGRLALPIAFLGACRLLGTARLRTALLCLWAVPVPNHLLELTSRILYPLLPRVASAVPWLLGTPVEIGPDFLRIGVQDLAWKPWDAGFGLVALLSGLGWYAGLRLQLSPADCARRACVWGCLGIPLQLAGLAAAMGLVALGAGAWGRGVLDEGLWLAVGAAGLVRVQGLARREGRAA